MYSVIKKNHSKYGNVIVITVSKNGNYNNPFHAFEKFKLFKRLFENLNPKYMFKNKVLSFNQIKYAISKEYFSLKKCRYCASILNNNIYKDAFVNNSCSDICFNKVLTSKLEEEEEYECL